MTPGMGSMGSMNMGMPNAGMNMGGMPGGMNNMGINIGGMRNPVQMGQMNQSMGMGMSFMGGTGGGMMPHGGAPRSQSQGNINTGIPGQVPGNQFHGQIQARIGTPVSAIGPQVQPTQAQGLHHSPPPQQPGFTPSTPTSLSSAATNGMGISLNGTDGSVQGVPFPDSKTPVSPGVVGGMSGVSGPNINMGANDMQLRQMQAMQERKAMALAAMQQQPNMMNAGTPGVQSTPNQQALLQAQRLQSQLPMQTPPRPGTAGGRSSVPPTPAAGIPVPIPALGASAMPSTPARTSATPAAAPTVAANQMTNGNSGVHQYSLPPLPANVQLNPAVTKVTPVPLSQSGTLIPPLSNEEIEDIKKWMASDREYEARFRTMKERAKQEMARIGLPAGAVSARSKWWERDQEMEAGVAERRKKEKFALEYPHTQKESMSRRRGKRREGLKIPGRLKINDANRTEQLVPIRLEFDVEHYKYRDTFVWNLNGKSLSYLAICPISNLCFSDPIVTPEAFAQSVVDDYGLPSSYHSVITKAIQEQLSDFKAHSAMVAELETGIVDVDAIETEGPLLKGALEGDELQWWENWRKRLRNKDGYVKTRSILKSLPEPPTRSKKRRKAVYEPPKVVDKDGPMDVEMFEFDEDKMHEEMRILIRV